MHYPQAFNQKVKRRVNAPVFQGFSKARMGGTESGGMWVTPSSEFHVKMSLTL
jgi:hypothetical protein